MGNLLALPGAILAYFTRLGWVRTIGMFAGVAFAGVVLISFASTLTTYFTSPPAATAEEEFHKHPKELALHSDGPFGTFDRAQVQRGFQVYKEVCAACHSMNLVSFHQLEGLGYNEAQIKAIANQWQTETPTVNPETGEAATRKSLPSDKIPAPYANDVAARAANNNALPPDLSLITKARHGGAAYVYSLLTGYQNQPAALLKQFPDAKTPAGLHYNPYFANLNLAMPPPLTTDGQVTYGEGNPKPTVAQMSKDVAAFLVWSAEPKLAKRNQTGWPVVLFLIVLTAISYLAYQNVWRPVKGNH